MIKSTFFYFKRFFSFWIIDATVFLRKSLPSLLHEQNTFIWLKSIIIDNKEVFSSLNSSIRNLKKWKLKLKKKNTILPGFDPLVPDVH